MMQAIGQRLSADRPEFVGRGLQAVSCEPSVAWRFWSKRSTSRLTESGALAPIVV